MSATIVSVETIYRRGNNKVPVIVCVQVLTQLNTR